MATTLKKSSRSRGRIEKLPSGSLRVKIYAGVDPLTKKEFYLRETVPAGPTARKEAEKVRTKLLNRVDERRNPTTRATVGQLLEKHLELLTVNPKTFSSYQGYVKNHIRPALGDILLSNLNGEVLDTFYAQLRRCRKRCGRRRFVEHRTDGEHECDRRCHTHACAPLEDSSLRQIHWILSSALKRAVRWRWIAINPMSEAKPPPPPAPKPQPPTAAQAARIAEMAWRADLDWGMLVWLTLRTGARRGEICALRWGHLDFEAGTLTIRRAIGQLGKKLWEADTKTHQQRRVALDAGDLDLMQRYRERRLDQANHCGLSDLPGDSFIFSLEVDGSRPLKPDSVSQRYSLMCKRIGIATGIHKLRHYSATELISGGVDIRTVAGRLGHGGGGTTTLRVYAAWVSEADQRASKALAERMPLAVDPFSGGYDTEEKLDSPYLRAASALALEIAESYSTGQAVPTLKEISNRFGVSDGTAHRIVRTLAEAGMVQTSRSHRTVVLARMCWNDKTARLGVLIGKDASSEVCE